jgi:DNA-binding beta-propeller fold protein YncE
MRRIAVALALVGASLAPGLDGARAVVASANGQHLYVASTDASGSVGAITVFARSPDESFVYVYGATDGMIAGFARGGDGMLTPIAGSPFDA